jgi:hypothetical protein
MAWVFRKCRVLTPGGALLVIAGAVLWLPVSFAAATAVHAALIAKAASLPAWMQLLHALAAILAKSKLLVLPVYPAAWPQAKKHALVQATLRFYGYFTSLHVVRKTGYRYRQTERALDETAEALRRAALRAGLGHVSNALIGGLDLLARSIGNASRAALARAVEGASRVPLVGSIVTSYAAQYAAAGRQRAEGFSERARGFFARWSIKFSAEYYDAKEKDEAAERHTRA